MSYTKDINSVSLCQTKTMKTPPLYVRYKRYKQRLSMSDKNDKNDKFTIEPSRLLRKPDIDRTFQQLQQTGL